MVAQAEISEYLAEIREQVCSRCVERPPGGPPCAPLGKDCGVELHLPALIDSIHDVHSQWIEPYLEHNRAGICEQCAFLHSSICPCPMDYLAVLIVQAVETVDERRQQGNQEQVDLALAEADPAKLEEIVRLYAEAAGTWKGCDWRTHFGDSELNLSGWTAAEAEAMAEKVQGTEAENDWRKAAAWLAQVERYACQAEQSAADAVRAAQAGKWEAAFRHAERAWALEFATGRPLRHRYPLTWQKLRQAVETALLAHEVASMEPETGTVD
jgi:hypothetical protein